VDPIALVVACGLWGVAALGVWLAYQLLVQNGRLLLRVEALEGEGPWVVDAAATLRWAQRLGAFHTDPARG